MGTPILRVREFFAVPVDSVPIEQIHGVKGGESDG